MQRHYLVAKFVTNTSVGLWWQTLPEAQRTQGIESMTWIIFLTDMNWKYFWLKEIIQVADSIPWVCCASGNVSLQMSLLCLTWSIHLCNVYICDTWQYDLWRVFYDIGSACDLWSVSEWISLTWSTHLCKVDMTSVTNLHPPAGLHNTMTNQWIEFSARLTEPWLKLIMWSLMLEV